MQESSNGKQQPLIITGLSGAGISSVLKTLEDLGFEVFDNFPISLIDQLIEETPDSSKLAIGVDARSRGFSAQSIINTCENIGGRLVFITCDQDVLLKRFSETRRLHPKALDKPVISGIKEEQAMLNSVAHKADLTIDTSDFSIHDLRHILEGHFGTRNEQGMTINLMSFGFRNGLPREADIVMDVRFVKNPHWDKELRPLSGQDKPVGDYIEEDEGFVGFFENLKTLVEPLIPKYETEGKNYLTIAIGCTGGRHRSVYTVEKLAKWLDAMPNGVHVTHRDLNIIA